MSDTPVIFSSDHHIEPLTEINRYNLSMYITFKLSNPDLEVEEPINEVDSNIRRITNINDIFPKDNKYDDSNKYIYVEYNDTTGQTRYVHLKYHSKWTDTKDGEIIVFQLFDIVFNKIGDTIDGRKISYIQSRHSSIVRLIESNRIYVGTPISRSLFRFQLEIDRAREAAI